MYVLDTNILKFYFEQPQNYPDMVRRIRDADARRLICITVVNAQEILHHAVNALKDRPDQKEHVILQLYEDLFNLLAFLRHIPVLPFDKDAYRRFIAISQVQTGIGTRDRRIAAIALARDATVVTANRRHFDLVPELKVENWTIRPPQPATQD